MNYLVSNQNNTHGGVVCETDDYRRAIAAAIRDSLDIADPVIVYAINRLGNVEYECAVIEHGKVTFDNTRWHVVGKNKSWGEINATAHLIEQLQTASEARRDSAWAGGVPSAFDCHKCSKVNDFFNFDWHGETALECSGCGAEITVWRNTVTA